MPDHMRIAMPKIFLSHNSEDLKVYYGKALSAMRELGEVVLNPLGRNLTAPELIEASRGCDFVVCHRATPGQAALFENSPQMIAFLRPQLDIRDVDIAAASANGIIVANAPASFIPATAEMALALMLDVARDVTASTLAYKAGEVPPSNMGMQLSGSTAGIIGYGAVGAHLARILVAIGMRVLTTDPYKTVNEPGVEQVDFTTLLRESDFVLPLAVATAETENLIDERAFALMKPTAYFVNISRGSLVDEEALEAAYRERRIAKLAMDVGRAADQRPTPELARLPGVVATPHLGGLTIQNTEAQSMSSVEQVAAMLMGQLPPRTVNPQSASRFERFRQSL